MSGSTALVLSNRSYPTPAVSSNFARNLFDWETLSSTSSMPPGGSISRAGNAMLYDSTGKLTYAPNNLLLQSNTFNVSPWTNAGTAPTYTSGQADPVGGTSATKVAYGAGFATLQQRITSQSGVKVIFSCWVRADSNGTIGFSNINGFSSGLGMFVANQNVTTTWQRFSVSFLLNGTNDGPSIYFDNAGNLSTIYVWGAQFEYVTYQTSPSGTYYLNYPTPNTTSAYYGPRFDYDPVTLQPKGLLVEGTRTNLCVQSQNITTTWAKAAAGDTVSATAATSPTGETNGNSFIADGTNAAHFIYTTSNGLVANTVQTWSVYLKNPPSSAANYVYIDNYYSGAANGYISQIVNLTNGSLSQISVGSSASVISTNIQNVGGGWYRISVTGTINGTGAPVLAVGIAAAATGNTFDGFGRVNSFATSASFYMFGAQVETAAFATSYIPTVASSVARAAETFSLTGYANRLVEAYYIDEETGGSYSGNSALSTGTVTISPPTFGWVTSLRAYTNAYAGSISTPSWLSFSGTTGTTAGNRTYYDSTGTLTWAPSNIALYSDDQTNSYWTAFLNLNTSAPSSGVVNFQATNNAFRYANVTCVSGVKYIVSVVLSTGTKTGTITLRENTTATNNVITLTSTPTRYYLSVTATGAVLNVGLDIRTTVGADGVQGTVNVSGYQVEAVTYQTQPSVYIPTTSAAVYGPRYDFDPSTVPASPRGLLIEESRSNLVIQSQAFNTTWFNVGYLAFGSGSITDAAVAPDGTTTADKVVEDTSTSSHAPYKYNISVAAGAHTLSCYVKAAERNWIQLTLYDGSTDTGAYFNVSTGTVGTTDAGITASIQGVGNGWYRCIITKTCAAGSGGPAFYLATGNGGKSYAGNGTSGILLWGAQLEAGSFATSYIPTTTASVTRAADVAQLTGSALTTLQGTNFSAGMQFTTAIPSASVNQQLLFAGTQGSTLALLYMNTNTTAGTYDPLSSPNASGTATTGSGGWTTTARAFLSNSAVGRSVVMNNGNVANASALVTARTAIQLGAYTNNVAYNCGWVASFAAYNQKLPDTILRQKSTVGAPY